MPTTAKCLDVWLQSFYQVLVFYIFTKSGENAIFGLLLGLALVAIAVFWFQ
ncbi:hypothetical protein H6G81_33970 [Scytonema hofmannii FACHB-248]|uniref:Uncharacterized protein n=1 Tax=Scytonema hofmannii FACHB-248 TaxID=1842502 RepID=A0ABR8H1Q4_9CYAN|nr:MULTISPECIES: hypothetical protein [Nostocales]MBD2609367.1 hypothetical protein [Scytonema hofmannii FACHB-248]